MHGTRTLLNDLAELVFLGKGDSNILYFKESLLKVGRFDVR